MHACPGGVLLGIRGEGVPPGYLFQTKTCYLISIPIFRPGLEKLYPFSDLTYIFTKAQIMSSLLRLERRQQICLNSALMIYFGYFSFRVTHLELKIQILL